MTEFVWLEVPGGGRVPVNPDQVAYLRSQDGRTELVFGAVQGGLHTLAVAGDGESVAAQLEASPRARSGAKPAPAAAKQRQRQARKR